MSKSLTNEDDNLLRWVLHYIENREDQKSLTDIKRVDINRQELDQLPRNLGS